MAESTNVLQYIYIEHYCKIQYTFDLYNAEAVVSIRRIVCMCV